MKIADLYIRVSTDEQADKGYSQRGQEEVLTRYCDFKGIRIRKVIYEDHSAKTFNRPEWQKLLIDLKKKRGQSDLILFTKWDRFSRNAGDAYQMINTLANLGVEPQAIEQPLDLSIPENKLMLAIYLAQPEVENDRRALNTFFGMRRARKEGRWMGPAVVGYVNKTTEDGKKYICPQEPNASIMRWCYEQLATGNWYIDQVWKAAHEKGLSCGRKNFWQIIRNPVYCGKIFISKYKDEEAHLVKGLHEPIISEGLFNEVIDVLDGRKKTYKTQLTSPDELPLRGFLICPKCGYMLTGSASKGCRQYYHYYHCFSKCGVRFNAKLVNAEFEKNLKKHAIDPGVIPLYKSILTEVYDNAIGTGKADVVLYKQQLNEYHDKISKARDLLLKGHLDGADYRDLKNDCERKVSIIEGKLVELSAEKDRSIGPLLDKALKNVARLPELYQTADSEGKRRIVSSMYPEKMTFDGVQHRTTRLNEAIVVFDSIKAVFEAKKKDKSAKKADLSSMVAGSRIELPTLGL
ncbi:recombinase family protein [Mucilaginibacter hurinus]|uniref:Recombinase family protein n=1 Tax=Mucilaginibacter hurinus TaxID=2201324 RepID=A0A367GLJ3_9SPHI|nr:recombinase family protein [Mucilaginibacter hurinus]RCH53623.1 recombinase family protein [Mucilaginibacter hurinus]